MEIKTATISDIPLIRELTSQVWPQTYTPIVGEAQVKYMLDKFYDPDALKKQMEEMGHKFIIGYDDGQPVAFASYSEVTPTVYKLHKLYIILSCQGKGVGKTMIGYIVNDLKASNAAALRLNVNKYNDAARKFYEKAGFTQFAEEDIDIGSGYFMNDYVLTLPISR